MDYKWIGSGRGKDVPVIQCFLILTLKKSRMFENVRPY